MRPARYRTSDRRAAGIQPGPSIAGRQEEEPTTIGAQVVAPASPLPAPEADSWVVPKVQAEAGAEARN